MDAVRKIVETSNSKLTIEVPDDYNNRKLEVIVLPLDEAKIEEDATKPKYDLSRFVGKLHWEGDAVAEQRRLRDEWE